MTKARKAKVEDPVPCPMKYGCSDPVECKASNICLNYLAETEMERVGRWIVEGWS
jgi:hypothetical protein